MNKKKATIKTVAQEAGVSVATVSYVINEGPRAVTALTRKKVLDAMKLLNYEPNAAARSLANKKTNTIGLVFAGLADSNLSGSNFFDYVRGISYEVESKGLNLLLYGNHKQAREKNFFQPIVQSNIVDGLVLIGSSIPDSALIELHNSNFPTVLLARNVPDHDIYYVQQNYRQGAYDATVHLIKQGYKRIGFLGQNQCFSYAVDRLKGYSQALADFNLTYDSDLVVLPNTVRDDPTTEDIQKLLNLQSPADALISDREIQVIEIVRRLKYNVPAQIAIVGLDESETGLFLDIPLTTVRSPKFEMGRAAVQKLTAVITGGNKPEFSTIMPMELIIRDSSPLKN